MLWRGRLLLKRREPRRNENRGGHRSQAVECLGSRSRIGQSFCLRIDDLSVSGVEFLRKVEVMQDSLAAAVV